MPPVSWWALRGKGREGLICSCTHTSHRVPGTAGRWEPLEIPGVGRMYLNYGSDGMCPGGRGEALCWFSVHLLGGTVISTPSFNPASHKGTGSPFFKLQLIKCMPKGVKQLVQISREERAEPVPQPGFPSTAAGLGGAFPAQPAVWLQPSPCWYPGSTGRPQPVLWSKANSSWEAAGHTGAALHVGDTLGPSWQPGYS